ncbi:MAG TPA: MEDS domain-containing protein [Kineosporiaceae bacterium]|nr:MEDS domain-containing protein [Kineosporiaceae bacterium]
MADRRTPDSGGAEDLGFTEEQLGSNHVCLIYDGDTPREQLLAQYVAAGLREGEVVRYFADVTPAEQVRGWLEEFGVDVTQAEARGALVIGDATTTYCPGGIFDPAEVISRIGAGYEAAHRAGFTGTRSTGEMSWVRRGLPGSNLFLEYEIRLGAVSTPYRHNGMCQYDARLFDGASLFKVLQVHPFMVAQGQVVRNPCYRRPGESPLP